MERLRRRSPRSAGTKQVHFRVESSLFERFLEAAALTREKPTDAHRAAMQDYVDHHSPNGGRFVSEVKFSLGRQRLLLRLFVNDDNELLIRVTGIAANRAIELLKKIRELSASEGFEETVAVNHLSRQRR